MSNKNRIESAESLWDVDFELADQRISARRNRIRQRLDALKKVQKMIQVKHIFGYTGTAAGEQFPVQVRIRQCPNF
jgi:DNA-binding response OmpR family regulator